MSASTICQSTTTRPVAQTNAGLPVEVTKWAAQYRGFLTSVRRADPAIEYDDLLHDLYVLHYEQARLSLKAIASKYHLRKLGEHWIPQQPNSNWSDWDRYETEAESVAHPASERECENAHNEPLTPTRGLVADTERLAKLLKVGRRRGQQIRQRQISTLSAQVRGMPECNGQLGLFADAALGVCDAR